MPTRSGKPYQEPKKKEEYVQDVSLNTTNTPMSKDNGYSTNASTLSCGKDLRKKNRKRAISITNADIDNATDSNWVVSDIPCNVKQTNSAVKNMIANIYDEFESKNESTATSRKLRERKSSTSNDIMKVKKIKKNNSTVQDLTDTINNVEVYSIVTNPCEHIKNISQNEADNDYEMNTEGNYQIDTENDINSANVTRKYLKNKKKGKNKKKKIRPNSSPLKMCDTDTEDKHLSNSTVNFSQSSVKLAEKRNSNMKDITYGKGDEILTQNLEKNHSNNISIDGNNLENKYKPNSPNIVNSLKKRKPSIRNSTLVQNNKILDTTYENDGSNVSHILTNNDLNLNVSTGTSRRLRMTTSDKELISDNVVTEHVNNEEISNSDNDVPIIGKIKKKKISTGSPMSVKKRKADVNDITFEIQTEYSVKDKKSFSNGTDIENLEIPHLSPEQLCSRKSNIINTTFEKQDVNSTYVDDVENLEIPHLSPEQLCSRKSNIINTTFEKQDVNSTYVDDVENITTGIAKFSPNVKDRKNEPKINVSFDKNDKEFGACDRAFDAFKKGAVTRRSSLKNNTSINTPLKENTKKERILSSSATKRQSLRRHTIDFNNSVSIKLDSTFDITPNRETDTTHRSSKSLDPYQTINTTFDKDIENRSKSSLISSDNSNSYKYGGPRISITSDESEENIADTTPICIRSSMDESKAMEDLKDSTCKPQTPLIREGTFTKDSSEIQRKSPQTPTGSNLSVMPQAGCTPYYATKSSQKKAILNVTRSVEKRMSLEAAPRLTRVMFCSPVDNPAVIPQEKSKIIKSNLKGSNKSFVFEEEAALSRPARKRSYTHSEADINIAKRSRLTHDQKSVERTARPRTVSASGKITNLTPKKPTTPKSQTKTARPLPNFAALHQKQFAKMESLTEYKERKATRARQMLTPSGAKDMLERISPKNDTEVKTSKQLTKDKTDTPTKKVPTLESLRPAYTRFGFKLNLDVNPFSVPAKIDKPKEMLNPISNPIPSKPLPSLTGATLSKRENSFSRREAAKQAVMREKSFLGKRSMSRKENRTIIKGVRTNRRFELQMKFRNVDN